MTTISREEVIKVAHLARLSITEEKIDEYARNLSNILALVEQMNEVDTDGIEPMAHPLETVQSLREDKVTETDRRESMQGIAPATEKGLYLVPKVIE